jgi:hypothetical protein
MDVSAEAIKSGAVNKCYVSVYLEPTQNAKPGYYTIELISKWTGFGLKDIKYLRGDKIATQTWGFSGGDTWLAIGRGESLRDVFNINVSYSPFESSIPIFKGTEPTTIENAVFVMINNYRTKSGVASLSWDQDIQDDARIKAMNLLFEGIVLYAPLEPPYEGQLIFSSRTFSTETPTAIARKAVDSWISNASKRNTLLEENFKSMAVGYTVESRESVYFIEVLFTIQ